MSARDPVQFTRESAERIANVVRAAELTPTRGRPLTFDAIHEAGRGGGAFRMATFTGAWPINTANVVTLANGATLAAVNRFFDHPNVGTRNCAVARDGTAWHLIQWQWDAATALSSATLGGSLEFGRVNVPSLGTASTVSISVTTCSTATAS
jgi:hypothetical protein